MEYIHVLKGIILFKFENHMTFPLVAPSRETWHVKSPKIKIIITLLLLKLRVVPVSAMHLHLHYVSVLKIETKPNMAHTKIH